MKIVDLNGKWELRGKRQEFENGECISLSAEVPGCVQLDLSCAGILPKDLFFADNIEQTERFEDYEWWYERDFSVDAVEKNAFLVFEGVDTVAEYYLNGKKIGESDNMFISHEFPVSEYLKEGTNRLVVHIRSAVIEAHKSDVTALMMNWSGGAVETPIRRAPHTYGWDIMPRAVTVGLWRDVRLEVRDSMYLKQLYFRWTNSVLYASYQIDSAYSDLEGARICFRGGCKDSTFDVSFPLEKRGAATVVLPIQKPYLWWPYGYGDANVYDVSVSIYRGEELIHEKKDSFGLRSIKLERTEITDGINGKFHFYINGVQVMCLGSNWVPLDAFHSRDKERYAKALELVKDSGCNILRCWGGNVYEDHEFFDFCDHSGIMVWQDFSMACRIYPENEEFKKALEIEATAVVRKLRNHPSIILWSGDNENDAIIKNVIPPDDNTLTRVVLPAVVRHNDVTRPYIGSSPFISNALNLVEGKGSYRPEDHLWGPRDYYKSDFYKQSKAHFVSETGYHGCPALTSIKKFISPERVWPYTNNPEWNLHSSDQQNSDHRVMLMHNQVMQMFGEVPTDPETYVLASQISQAEAKKFFIERIRTDRPNKSGVIWWNLLDGWPQMSDAVVDYYFEKKLAYYYIKRIQKPFIVAAGELYNWRIPLFACNNTLEVKNGNLTVIDAESSEIVFKTSFSVGANTSAQIGKIPVYYSERKLLILKWQVGEISGANHYLCGFPPFSLDWYVDLMKKHALDTDEII